jgi:hypothetical protein
MVLTHMMESSVTVSRLLTHMMESSVTVSRLLQSVTVSRLNLTMNCGKEEVNRSGKEDLL